MVGTTARRHCLAEATATLPHRSIVAAAPRAIVRAVITGSIALTPIIVASRMTASILSPLSTACTSVSGTRTSGAGVIGAPSLNLYAPPRRRNHARPVLPPTPIEHGDISPCSKPHHPREVMRLVFRQHRITAGRIERRQIEARQHHAEIIVEVALYSRRAKSAIQQSQSTSVNRTNRQSAVANPQFFKVLFRGQTLGKYKIIAPLGSGGFGTVYLAQDTWIDKKVAIKVPHRQGLDFGELLREPRLLASVSHPNIVAITTAEKQDNVFFIVMEYVQGETLENMIARARRARAEPRARLHLPDLQRRRSRAHARASSIATCGRPTCWSPRTTC